MSNNVHLVVVPRKAEALALALKQPHGRYAYFPNPVSLLSASMLC